jgi:hypothetical protein
MASIISTRNKMPPDFAALNPGHEEACRIYQAAP